MELTASFVKALPIVTGQGKNGTWTKQEFVLKTSGQYPKDVCFEAWGERTEQVSKLKEGDQVTVLFDLESREYNGRYYTTAKVFKMNTPEVVHDEPFLPVQDAVVLPSNDGLPF